MLEAGTRLFSEREYRAVSMEEVARAADVSKPMVYAYFGSKQGLLLACIEHWTRELMRRLKQATPSSLPPDIRMWRGLAAVFAFLEEHPEAWALLYPYGPRASGQLAAGAARAHEAMTGLISRLLRDAAVAEGIDRKVAGEATQPMAHALVAAVQATAGWWLRHRTEPAERQALRLMNFAWMGFDNLLRGKLWLPVTEGDEPALEPAEPMPAGDREELVRRLGEDRDALLDEVFERMAASFDPGRAGPLDAVLEWRIGGRPDGGEDRFQLVLRGGRCEVAREGGAEPTTVLTIDAPDFIDLLAGEARGGQLFSFGKLKVEGDVPLAARMPRFFVMRRGTN
jgi:AcrR family transcriptional regulator